jgi:hypothetical protein
MRNPNDDPSKNTKKSSSVVRMGCTWVSRPKCNATACMMNARIMTKNPASQMPRRSA